MRETRKRKCWDSSMAVVRCVCRRAASIRTKIRDDGGAKAVEWEVLRAIYTLAWSSENRRCSISRRSAV